MARLTDGWWQQYRIHGDMEARSRLLDSYLGLVLRAAQEMARRVSRQFELDDLVGAGTLGLVQALERFDPSRKLEFSTFAMPRIRGAILDELRGRDWMPRALRARQRHLTRSRAALQQHLGREPSAGEIARELGIDLDTYWRWVREANCRVMLALDQKTGSGTDGVPLFDTVPDALRADPCDSLTREEALNQLRQALMALPEKDRLVLSLYYYERLTLKQIGEVFHVTESRVSQIRRRAISRLREQVQLAEEGA